MPKAAAAAAPETAAAAPPSDPAAAPPGTAVEELPRAIVRRVVKEKLDQLSSAKEGAAEDISVQKDALIAFGESARIFIHYLSATANDLCMESKRQTISAEDVFKALEEIEFPEFIEPLRASLEEFRRQNAEKKSVTKAKDSGKKRKLTEEEAPTEDGEEAADDVEEQLDNADENEDEYGAPVGED